MLKIIEIPNYIREGIKKMNQNFEKNINLLVGDTETIKGVPYCFQWYNGEKIIFEWQSEIDILESFFRYLKQNTFPNKTNLMFFHGLHFDIGIIFHKYQEHFLKNSFKFNFSRYEASGDIKCGKMVFGDIQLGKNHSVKLLDTYRFTMSSLKKSCEELGLPIKKMKRPDYIGERAPTKKEMPYFKQYASTDVYATYELAKWVIKIHEEVNTSISLSIPHLGSKVLRSHFMREKDKILFPQGETCINSILSYHGGKNSIVYDHPVLIDHAYSYDIISAYPWAMSILPSMLDGKYTEINNFDENLFGIYEVSGKYTPCKYKHLYNHLFKNLPAGKFENICFTSPEIKSALNHCELKIEKINGYVFESKSLRNPIKDFVTYYFNQKTTAKKGTLPYTLAKLLLNSLYGKFIQTTDYDQKENIVSRLKNGDEIVFEEIVYRAGGLFNPFIASLITGLVRSKIHELEHAYDSLHCATDGIFCLKPAETKDELGELKFENEGPLLLLRNKLYVMFKKNVDPYQAAEKIIKAKTSDKAFALSEKYIYKYALHGFQAPLQTLLKLWINKENNYQISRMVNIKEAFKNKNLNLTPLAWHTFNKTLEINWNEFKEVKNERMPS